MTGVLTVEQIRENVAQSRRHIAKQEAIIARLKEQGHTAAAEEAAKLLPTMRSHLDTELGMLDRMDAVAGAERLRTPY